MRSKNGNTFNSKNSDEVYTERFEDSKQQFIESFKDTKEHCDETQPMIFEESLHVNKNIPSDSIEISTEFLDFITDNKNSAIEVVVQQVPPVPPCENDLKYNLEQLLLPIQAAPPSEAALETISMDDIETLGQIATNF